VLQKSRSAEKKVADKSIITIAVSTFLRCVLIMSFFLWWNNSFKHELIDIQMKQQFPVTAKKFYFLFNV